SMVTRHGDREMAAATPPKWNTVFSQKRCQESGKPHLRTRQTQWTLSPSPTPSPKSSMAASMAGSRRGSLETLAAARRLRAERSKALSARSGGGLAAAWAGGFQAGSARVARSVFESLRNAGAARDEGRARRWRQGNDRRAARAGP